MSGEPVLVAVETLRQWPLPDTGSDKESRGRVLVVGGSAETPGAVRLAGEAALRAGAGKLQLATARSTAAALAVAVPEAKVVPLPEDAAGHVGTAAAGPIRELADAADVVLLGPGLTDVPATAALLEQVVPHLDTRVVVDALGSAFVTAHPDGLRHLGGRCVLTVNPTELSRVLGLEEGDVATDQLGATRDLAARTGVTVLCGGSEKTVADPAGSSWLLQHGNRGLGVSGSGDVQAGVVAGLLARGATPAQAAVWGGYAHGRSGERLAVRVAPLGYLARELLDEVPAVLVEGVS